MSTDIELQPCPFCGDAATLGEDAKHAICLSCKTTTWIFVAAWNRRATPSPAPIQQSLPHGHREDFYLLANARLLAARSIAEVRRMPNWVLAMELFATGSTSANEICRVAGIDPHETKVERIKVSAPADAAKGGDTKPTCRKCPADPNKVCDYCGWESLAPTVKASQSDTHPSATARNEKD